MKKQIALTHPLHNCPAVAEALNFWIRNGRNVGLKLQFADGHTTHMTYIEIQELQNEESEETAVSAPSSKMAAVAT